MQILGPMVHVTLGLSYSDMVTLQLLNFTVYQFRQFNHSLQEASSAAAATSSIPHSLASAARKISEEFDKDDAVLEASLPRSSCICILYRSKNAVRLKRNFDKLQSHMLGICLAQMESLLQQRKKRRLEKEADQKPRPNQKPGPRPKQKPRPRQSMQRVE